MTPVVPFIKNRKLRALAVTISRRSSTLPEVPTLDESGLKGFDQGTWFGVLAPAGTPGDVVAKLNAEMVRVIQLPEFRKRMADIGAEPIGDSPAQMAGRPTGRGQKERQRGGVAACWSPFHLVLPEASLPGRSLSLAGKHPCRVDATAL
ncbi:hypothetical protein ET532_027705 [Verminephrobacter sp. Larva24]|nr:hypothetical protein ET532_027705 [Verminephrobacter sp. Larva24]